MGGRWREKIVEAMFALYKKQIFFTCSSAAVVC